jgi:hypothetical protein
MFSLAVPGAPGRLTISAPPADPDHGAGEHRRLLPLEAFRPHRLRYPQRHVKIYKDQGISLLR